jgi:hypothetical protein
MDLPIHAMHKNLQRYADRMIMVNPDDTALARPHFCTLGTSSAQGNITMGTGGLFAFALNSLLLTRHTRDGSHEDDYESAPWYVGSSCSAVHIYPYVRNCMHEQTVTGCCTVVAVEPRIMST